MIGGLNRSAGDTCIVGSDSIGCTTDEDDDNFVFNSVDAMVDGSTTVCDSIGDDLIVALRLDKGTGAGSGSGVLGICLIALVEDFLVEEVFFTVLLIIGLVTGGVFVDF